MAFRVLMKEFSLLDHTKIKEDYKQDSKSKNTNDKLSKDHQTEESDQTKKNKKLINNLLSIRSHLPTNTNWVSMHLLEKSLLNFYLLDGSVNSNSSNVLICFCIASIFVSKFLHLIYDFDLENSEFQISVKLFQIVLILKQNTMEVYDEFNDLPIGHAIYLTTSLLNHACRPNCTRYFNGNQVIITRNSESSISKNGELTISYGLPSGLNSKLRKEQLKNRFGFDCLCADCSSEEKNDE